MGGPYYPKCLTISKSKCSDSEAVACVIFSFLEENCSHTAQFTVCMMKMDRSCSWNYLIHIYYSWVLVWAFVGHTLCKGHFHLFIVVNV